MDRKKVTNLLIGLAVYFGIYLMPTPVGLTPLGQIALAITAMAIVLWMTEAVSYTVSAFLILGLFAICGGLTAAPDNPSAILGTSEALKQALSGFATPSLGLVAGGLFIAVAMEATGLHERLAFIILNKIGTKPHNLVVGIIIVTIILGLFVPSATARGGAIVPIVIGIVTALQADRQSQLMKMLLVTTVSSITVWNFAIKTSSAQNVLALQFIQEAFKIQVSWIQWLMYGAPLSIILSVILYFIVLKAFRVSEQDYVSDPEVIHQKLKDLGPISKNERKLMIYSLVLLFFWATEAILHPIDSTSITLAVFGLMLLPGIGILSWSDVEKKTSWGTLLVFAIGISLGTILLKTGAAGWLSEKTLGAIGVQNMSPVLLVVVLSTASVIIHLGFASATSLASVFIPIVIGLLGLIDQPTYNVAGVAIIQAFVISSGFILPVNAPQNMLAFGTGGYTARDLMKVGIPMTIATIAVIAVLSMTYWQWVGLL